MRKLNTADLFAACRIISRESLRDKIKPIVASASVSGISVEDIGIETLLTILGVLSEKGSEHAIYEVLSGPFEMDAKEVSELDSNTLFDKISELAMENDLQAFFMRLSGILGRN